MEQLVASQSTKRSRTPKALTFARATEILWESAWEALILAFLVLIFGSLVSGLWREMSPSLPPGLTGEPKLEAEGSALSFSFFRQNRLGLIFLVLFSGIAGSRLLKYSRSEDQRRAAAQAGRIFRRVSSQSVISSYSTRKGFAHQGCFAGAASAGGKRFKRISRYWTVVGVPPYVSNAIVPLRGRFSLLSVAS